jgi:alanyl-tRNA synthetase
MSMNTKAAHTAEHAFIGSLQKILNKTLSVRKVEHKESYNVAFINASEIQLDFEKISVAQKEVNRLILEGRKILHHSFPSMNEAKMKLPNLRANEARLADAEKITVVEIENHDVAACSMEHVNNLSECIFFLVTSLSKNGSDYEIKFMVGKNAMDEAVNASEKINMICDQIDANYNTVEATIRRLYDERQQYYGQLKKITNKMLNEIPIQHFEKNNITVISSILDNANWRIIQNFAGEKILESRTIIILINVDDGDTANLIFARSADVDLDCVKIFQNLRKDQEIGLGGGKPNFVNAKIVKPMSDKILQTLTEESLKLLPS